MLTDDLHSKIMKVLTVRFTLPKFSDHKHPQSKELGEKRREIGALSQDRVSNLGELFFFLCCLKEEPGGIA